MDSMDIKDSELKDMLLKILEPNKIDEDIIKNFLSANSITAFWCEYNSLSITTDVKEKIMALINIITIGKE